MIQKYLYFTNIFSVSCCWHFFVLFCTRDRLAPRLETLGSSLSCAWRCSKQSHLEHLHRPSPRGATSLSFETELESSKRNIEDGIQERKFAEDLSQNKVNYRWCESLCKYWHQGEENSTPLNCLTSIQRLQGFGFLLEWNGLDIDVVYTWMHARCVGLNIEVSKTFIFPLTIFLGFFPLPLLSLRYLQDRTSGKMERCCTNPKLPFVVWCHTLFRNGNQSN